MRRNSKLLTWMSSIFMTIITLGLLVTLAFVKTDWVPNHWNPLKSLNISAPLTPMTRIQMQRALASKQACVAVLKRANIQLQVLDDFTASNNSKCGISNRIVLMGLGEVGFSTLETNCEIALRLAMWGEHGVRPAARQLLGTDVQSITQLGSYNCRQMRTSGGSNGRMSQHATANAIDISGFTFDDGHKITLLQHWNDPQYHDFLKRVNRAGCRWFNGVLGPDYNSLHANHFHFDLSFWRFCR